MSNKETELTSKLKQLQSMAAECEILAKQTYGKKAYLFLEGNNNGLHVCYEKGGDPVDEILLDPKIYLPIDFGWFF